MEAIKKEDAPLQQDDPQTKLPIDTISSQKQIVKPDATTWIADMRRELGLKVKDVLPVIRVRHPKYDAALHSKVERPEDNGVMLVPSTAKAVKDAFGWKPPKRPRKSENRTHPCRVQGRLTESEYARLQMALKAKGIEHIQDWVHGCAMREIDEYERTVGR